MIWNSILAAGINPETSEAVFVKTLKQCIKVGLLQLFDIYFDFDNFYERKKCCDVTEELPLSYMDLICLSMIIILIICLLFFFFLFGFCFCFVFLFAQLHLAQLYNLTYTWMFQCVSDMELISLFGFHAPFAIHVIFFHICVLGFYLWHIWCQNYCCPCYHVCMYGNKDFCDLIWLIWLICYNFESVQNL